MVTNISWMGQTLVGLETRQKTEKRANSNKEYSEIEQK